MIKLQLLDQAIEFLNGPRGPGNKQQAVKLLLELREILSGEEKDEQL